MWETSSNIVQQCDHYPLPGHLQLVFGSEVSLSTKCRTQFCSFWISADHPQSRRLTPKQNLSQPLDCLWPPLTLQQELLSYFASYSCGHTLQQAIIGSILRCWDSVTLIESSQKRRCWAGHGGLVGHLRNSSAPSLLGLEPGLGCSFLPCVLLRHSQEFDGTCLPIRLVCRNHRAPTHGTAGGSLNWSDAQLFTLDGHFLEEQEHHYGACAQLCEYDFINASVPLFFCLQNT